MSRVFGNRSQVGYIAWDIGAAMDVWIEHGAGPRF